jgi:hypothetical protein
LRALVLCLLVGCTAVRPPAHSEARPGEASNAITRIALEKGIKPGPIDRYELCRRLAVDLLGHAPSDEERATCLSQTTEATVDAWMKTTAYERVERRHWADLTLYDVRNVWYPQLVDLDAMVTRLHRGEMTYGEFATRFVVHPAFYARHPDEDWIRAIYTMFLGRAARPDEVRALNPLIPVWSERSFYDGIIGERGDMGREIAFDLCGCSQRACATTALGRPVDFGKRACTDGDPVLVRTIAVTGGQKRRCQGCKDNPSGDEELKPLEEATPEEKKALYSLGEALTARPDFWEAAVDREMRRLFGWWQSSFKRFESDLPEVRLVLARELQRAGDVRAMKRTILTSVLYAMPARGSGDGAPWTSGPRKLLVGEAWLDSAAVALGETLGSCDPRFPREIDDEELSRPIDPRLSEESKGTLAGETFDYAGAALSLGGCGYEARPTSPTLGVLQAQRGLAARLCAESSGALPRGWDGSLARAAEHLVDRIYRRPASAGEIADLEKDMKQCLAAGDRGCSSNEAAARWTCARLLSSAEFGTY